jgi:hypothetical protein
MNDSFAWKADEAAVADGDGSHDTGPARYGMVRSDIPDPWYPGRAAANAWHGHCLCMNIAVAAPGIGNCMRQQKDFTMFADRVTPAANASADGTG